MRFNFLSSIKSESIAFGDLDLFRDALVIFHVCNTRMYIPAPPLHYMLFHDFLRYILFILFFYIHVSLYETHFHSWLKATRRLYFGFVCFLYGINTYVTAYPLSFKLLLLNCMVYVITTKNTEK